MSTEDPIWKALVEGDASCPDGQALVAMGALCRTAARPPRAVGLVTTHHSPADDTSTTSTAWHEDDPVLVQLGQLMRQGASPERLADLLPCLEQRLQQSASRRSAAQVDGHTRWRIWTTVAALHAAALLLLAVLNVPWRNPGLNDRAGVASLETGTPSLAAREALKQLCAGEPPVTWHVLRNDPARLYALRQEDRRDSARRFYLMEGSTAEAQGLVTWLVDGQDDVGAFALSGKDADLDLASQAAAVLAVAGEGVGTEGRRRVLRLGQEELARRLDRSIGDAAAAALSALAFVEGAALGVEIPDWRGQARRSLDLAAGGGQRGPATALLLCMAVEQSLLAGLEIPPALRAWSAPELGLRDPVQEPPLLASVAWARLVAGGVPHGRQLAAQVAQHMPLVDDKGRIDPLQWYGAGLVVREHAGPAWAAWSETLQNSVLSRLVAEAHGRFRLPAAHCAQLSSAEPAADVLATALASLVLQLPQRHLPLAHP